MALRSFEKDETDRLLTTPNLMTAARLVGGPILGVALMRQGIDPTPAIVAGGILASTDDEGHPIAWAAKPEHERIRNRLRLFPSTIGRKADPVADKMLVIPVFAGALMGGYIDPIDALPIVGAELMTSGASLYLDHKGYEPRVNTVGKIFMFVKCAVMGLALEANNLHGTAQEVVQDVVHGSAMGAAIGSLVGGALIVKDAVERHRSAPIA